MGRKPRISREQILEAARGVFVAKGFDAATLADIAAPLGVTPAAILRHIGSKQKLFAESMAAGEQIRIPTALTDLASVDASTDPRAVLRRVAQGVIPFVRSMIAEHVIVSLHRTSLEIPFDPQREDTPPKRALRIVADYFRRAAEAGVIRTRDPRASALLFVGSLQSYVLIHHVLNVRPVYPLRAWIDALLDLWTSGAFGGSRGKKNHPARDRVADRRERGVVRARKTEAAGARPRRHARSADGERRVARRRPRDPRARR